MYNDNHFTKDAYEDNGRFQIHPLSSEGLEAYLSKDSYNYHYLKSKYDPEILKQIEEELKQEKELKNQLKKQNDISEQNKNIENPKIEDVKVENTKNNNVNQNAKNKKVPEKKNKNTGVNKGKINKSTNNNMKKKENYGNFNMNKIGTIGRSTNPVIVNVKDDRGRLKDFQQPYHA